MLNAKEELLGFLERSDKTIKCAHIATEDVNRVWSGRGEWGVEETNEKDKTAILKVGHKEEQLNKFLNDLDFEYDNGYGLQVVYGTVWFEDGTWLERGEYDGSEWWVLRELPAIPNELK